MSENRRRAPAALRGGSKPDWEEEGFHIRVACRGTGSMRDALAEVNKDYAELDQIERAKLDTIGDIGDRIMAKFVRPVIAPRKGKRSTVDEAMVAMLLVLRMVDEAGFARFLVNQSRYLANQDKAWGALVEAWQELTLDPDTALYNLRWIARDDKSWESLEDSWKRLASALAEFTISADLSTETAERLALAKVSLVQARVAAAGVNEDDFVAAVEAERERLSTPEEEPAAATTSEA